MKTLLLLTIVSVLTVCFTGMHVASDSTAAKPADEPASKIVLVSDVQWEPLNPARGDNSPQAGTLWGDRNGFGATGFLVKFVDGFSSPPHIHNVTYRAVVISGLIHNDDPDAEVMWLPTGSFWIQPAGEAHITAAKGSHNLAYIEIEDGPYLVRPTDEAFDNGERPINVDASNIVWLDASNTAWGYQPGTSGASNRPKLAFLWGNPQGNQGYGVMVKLPVGYTGMIRTHGSTLHAVVVQGRPKHREPGKTDIMTLEPGSYFSSKGKLVHQVSCGKGEECVIYMRMAGKFEIISVLP